MAEKITLELLLSWLLAYVLLKESSLLFCSMEKECKFICWKTFTSQMRS